MASKVDIVNTSLALIGAESVIDLGEDNPRAKTMSRLYDDIRREVIAEGEWSFSIKRATLAKLAAAPVWGFGSAFQVPSDALRILEAEDQSVEWQREADQIVTDQSAMKVRYVADIDDPNKYTPGFLISFAYRLASAGAYPLTNSATLAKSLYDAYTVLVSSQRSVDSMQGTAKKFESTEIINARFGTNIRDFSGTT